MIEAIEKLIGSSYMLGLIHAEEENPERKISAADETDIPAIPFTEAMNFFKSKVPITKAEWLELEPKLRFRAFTVAQLGAADVVNKAKEILIKSFEKGGESYSGTWEQLKKVVNTNALGIKPGYWENVFRTNTQSAYIAGKLQQYENTGVAAYQLLVIEDNRTSKICRHLLTSSGYGMIISVDHPFWKKYGFPPYHFQCRTSIRAVYPSEVGKRGNMVENPTMKSLSKFKVQDGFGGNPLDRGNWWDLTDSMKRQAIKYGIKAQFDKAKEILIFDQASREENIQTILEKIKAINQAEKELKALANDVKQILNEQAYFKEMDPELRKMFLGTIERMDTDRLTILKNYLGKIEILKAPTSATASYFNGDKIYLKYTGDLYHELGHFIDNVIVEGKRARDCIPDFLDILKEDALKWVNNNSDGVTVTSLDKIPRDVAKLINKKMKQEEKIYSDVSDILDGLTRGKLGGKKNDLPGHEKGYYDFNDTVKHIEGESIAISTEAYFLHKAKHSICFRETFPKAYNKWIDFLRS